MINEGLYKVVKELCRELIEGFEGEGNDLCANSFLAQFSYLFLTHDQPERQKRILDAALSPPHKEAAEKTIEAAYVNHAGGSFEFYVADAVEDFLNYIIPRIVGLPDGDAVFDLYYGQFDESLYGDKCVVTTFALLHNVWDNSGRVLLPPGFHLRYYSKMPMERTADRWARDRVLPYFEISQSAHPRFGGHSLEDEYSYFVFSYSTALRKSKGLIEEAYTLRDEITRKFLFATRLLTFSAAYADYRGFRLIGHLSRHMNLMNFPEDVIRGDAREFSDYDGLRLRRLLPKLAIESYDSIAVLDTKIEDALRRGLHRMGLDRASNRRLLIDQLLDYFQILEAVIPAAGSEFIALYAAVLLHAVNKNEDAESAYDFVKRMHVIRNDVMHGRVNTVFTKGKLTLDDIHRFRGIIYALAGAFVMNRSLRDTARMLVLGKQTPLIPMYVETTMDEMKAMRQQTHPPAWW